MRWWTSDWHLGHTNIIEFSNRPFYTPHVEHFAMGDAEVTIPDVEKMNQALIDNFNDLVDVGDEAWFVGDIAMGRLQTTVPLIKKLKCRNLYCVPGNHDACHKMHGKYKKFVPLYEDAGFTILDPEVKTHIDGYSVKVCHFPYTGDSKFDDRFSGNRPTDEGGHLIHGHTHSHEKVRGRQIHVGVDAWDMRPASEDQIAQIIRENP